MSVYFITAREVGKVKIGCADDPWDRLHKLRTASPVELALEVVLPGAYAEEHGYHQMFAAHRVRGEWFDLCPEIEALIVSSPAPERGHSGKKWSQRRKLLRLVEDNEAIEARAAQRQKTDEELVEESLRLEHETFAECMRWRERHGLSA